MNRRNQVLFSLAAGLVTALLLMIGGAPFSWVAWALSTLCIYLLVLIWKGLGGGRALAWMVALAFSLRLLAAIFLSLALPAWGYDEPAPNAGYIFLDAYQRDNEAWDLGQAEKPLWQAFGEDIRTDQYGGLLALSAGVYRYLSPDVHRPLLIVLMAAFTATAGVPFLYRAAHSLGGEGAATITTWIYVLYPESVLLGAAQMREPFIMGLSAAAFWALFDWQTHRRRALIVFAAALTGLVLISSRVAVPILAVLAGWFWLLHGKPERVARWKALLVGALVLLAIGIYGYAWLKDSSTWDAWVTHAASGWIQLLLQVIGDDHLIELVTVYGLTQPMLPAALIEPGAPIANTISTIRAAGWYALAPVLAYGLFAAWKMPSSRQKRIMLWLAAICWLWIIIASLRAGGDAWDNPRYRTHFIIWIALLAGLALQWARQKQSPWLARWYAVEAAFLLPVTFWYLGRYWPGFPDLPFSWMIALIGLLAGAVLAGGWLWDRYAQRRVSSGPQPR